MHPFSAKSRAFIKRPPEKDKFITILSGSIRSGKTWTMSAKILASLHRQRAMGQMEPIVYRGEVTGEVMRKSDVLAMFYLKGKRPEFRDTAKVEVNLGDKLSQLADAIQGKGEDLDEKTEDPKE
jgi:hypothetical protein